MATGAVNTITKGYPAPGLRNTERFITAHGADGKGYFQTSDHGDHHRVMGEKQAVMNILYSTKETPVDLNDDVDIKFAKENEPALNIPHGSVVRMMDFGPGLESIPHGVITIDYGVVLEGEFRLTLDSGESRILKRGDMLIQRATTHKWENISGGGTECGRILFVLLGCNDVVVGGKKINADLGVLEKEYARDGNGAGEKALLTNGHSAVNGDASAVNGESAPNGVSKTSAVGFEEVESGRHETPSYSKLTIMSVQTSRTVNGNAAKGTAVPNVADSLSTKTTSLWTMTSRWLPSRTADLDYWWQLTGPHMATLFSEAGYSLHESYEAMVFYYHVIVPRLGPRLPPNGSPAWKSLLTVDGTPIEYSWKWNTIDGAPDVRYTMEPIGNFAGTVLDPLNQESTFELLYQLGRVMPSLDLKWFRHFANAFFDTDKEAYATQTEGRLVSTLALAFEFLKNGLSVKAYFGPKKLGQMNGPPPMDVWANAIKGAAPESTTMDSVVQFCKTDPEGSLLQPFMLAIDCVKPSKSRLKLYVQTPHTSFDSVRRIMTMGGQIKGVDKGLEELEELIKLVLSLPSDFPSSENLPATQGYAVNHFKEDQHLVEGYMYYFDIAPGSPLPDIKFYLPTRRYGKDDLSIAQGLMKWMDDRGRGQYKEGYMRVLESLASHRTLEERVGLQTYVSCCFQKGTLSMTTYMNPEVFDAQRVAK